MIRSLNRIKAMLAAAAITTAVFIPSARYGFVFFDDNLYVTENARVLEGLTADNVGWAFKSVGYASNWHPLTWISLMADSSLVRNHPDQRACVMHIHNVVLHAVNAALLVLLISFMCRGRLDCIWMLGLALLWSLHPLRTEVVGWVSERKEALSVFWMLLSVIFYVRPSERRLIGILVSLCCFALALLAKPVAVTLPIVMLAWDLLIERRVDWRRLVPYFALSVAVCYLTMAAQTEALASGAKQPPMSLVNSILGAPIVYLCQTIWPQGLSIIYEGNDSIEWAVVVPGVLLVLLMICAGIVWLAVRRRFWLDLTLFAIAWLYVGLVPMLGIVKVGSMEHSDRYTYWIGCGAVVCVAIALARAHESFDAVRNWLERTDGRPYSREKMRSGVLISLCLILCILAGVSGHYLPRWKDSLTLLRTDVPKCWTPEFAKQMADELLRETPPKVDAAEEVLRACAKRRPDKVSYRNLAHFLLVYPKHIESLIGDESMPLHYEAEMLLKTVLDKYPDDSEAKRLLDCIEESREKQKK